MTNPAVKMPYNPAAGASLTQSGGVITGIDGMTAVVTTPKFGVLKIPINNTTGKSGIPAVGESWLLDRRYGPWTFTMLIGAPVPAWATATLLGAWTHSNAAGTAWASGTGTVPQVSYYQGTDNWVQLRGVATSGSVSTATTAGPIAADIFRLPAGFRPGPAGLLAFGVVANGAWGKVIVFPDGYVRAAIGSGTAIDLSTVSFLTEQ